MAKTENTLYGNIRKRQAQVKAGTVSRMRKKGEKGAPTDRDFANAARTAKKK